MFHEYQVYKQHWLEKCVCVREREREKERVGGKESVIVRKGGIKITIEAHGGFWLLGKI